MTGGCLCAAVCFEIDGTRTPIEFCHCPRCRRSYGSAFAATFYVRLAGFRWLSGEDRVAKYDAPIIDEPPAYRHVFCRDCGSGLPIVNETFGVVEIPAGVMEAGFDTETLRHIFVSRKAAWFDPSDGLEQHDTHVAPSEHLIARILSED